ncbi:unnamed protein product [Sphagnum troendelagicum]
MNFRVLGATPFSVFCSSSSAFRKAKTLSMENGFAWVVAAVPCACALEGYAASDNCSPQDQAARGQFRGGNSSSRNLLLTVPMSQSFPLIQPFMLAELPLILKGWLCTVVAVGALFMFVPEIGELSHLLSQGDIKRLGQKAGKVLLLVAVRSVAQFWQQALLWEAALNITYKLRGFVYQHVLNRDMEYFEGEGGAAAGDIAYRLTAEAEDTGDTVHALLHTLVPSFLQLVAMAARMITLSPVLSFATISVVPVMSIVIAMLGEKLRELARKGQASVAGISAYLNEVLPSMFVVKAHAAEAFEQRRFERLALADCHAHLGKRRMKALIPEVITAVYAATSIILFGVGTWVISQGSFNGAGMVSFVTSLVLLIEPIQAMGKAYNELKQGEPAIERLFELTTFSPKVLEKQGTVTLKTVAGDVELCDVSFRYKGSVSWVLKDISLRVHAGQTVALVGPSGGGKTTLAKLLLRLYDPVQGSIKIDGHDIRECSLKSLRQQVAIVPQETTLFTGTVAENIAYGDMDSEIDMMEIERAARLSNSEEFILKLPNGFHTNLGDRASSLSGGQRQRLAIARAIYQKASILILDEATSALDNNSEKLVREALEHLMVGHTVFVIAHRLETVQQADRIILLDGGKLLEEGTHLSLIAKGGQYASLYSTYESNEQGSLLQRTLG